MYRVAVLGCLCLAAAVSAGVVTAPKQFRASRFSWELCSGTNLIDLQVLDVPEPFYVPGHNVIHVVMNIKEDLVSALTIKLRIAKITLFGLLEIPIPCIFDIGSCTYNDICPMLDEFWDENGHCPGNIPYEVLPCHCPIEATGGFRDYVIPFDISPDTIDGLLAWLASGEYTLKVEATMNGREVGCLEAEVDVTQG